jgi:hypothetical protein
LRLEFSGSVSWQLISGFIAGSLTPKNVKSGTGLSTRIKITVKHEREDPRIIKGRKVDGKVLIKMSKTEIESEEQNTLELLSIIPIGSNGFVKNSFVDAEKENPLTKTRSEHILLSQGSLYRTL